MIKFGLQIDDVDDVPVDEDEDLPELEGDDMDETNDMEKVD